MTRIFITGDIHAEPQKRLSFRNFPLGRSLKKDDYVIIAGDFGCVWDYDGESKREKHNLDWLEQLPFSVLFIDGNHENMVRLANYPLKEWNGGCVHEIRPHVLHLMRGYVFTINEKTFFTFGGASSHDIKDGILDPVTDKELIKEWNRDFSKLFRINNVTWWKEELPSQEEMYRGVDNLSKVDYKVDYVITHSPPDTIINKYGSDYYNHDRLTEYLDIIFNNTSYSHWYSGHLHLDLNNRKHTLVYKNIIEI